MLLNMNHFLCRMLSVFWHIETRVGRGWCNTYSCPPFENKYLALATAELTHLPVTSVLWVSWFISDGPPIFHEKNACLVVFAVLCVVNTLNLPLSIHISQSRCQCSWSASIQIMPLILRNWSAVIPATSHFFIICHPLGAVDNTRLEFALGIHRLAGIEHCFQHFNVGQNQINRCHFSSLIKRSIKDWWPRWNWDTWKAYHSM